jgi:hypothetical protein
MQNIQIEINGLGSPEQVVYSLEALARSLRAHRFNEIQELEFEDPFIYADITVVDPVSKIVNKF